MDWIDGWYANEGSTDKQPPDRIYLSPIMAKSAALPFLRCSNIIRSEFSSDSNGRELDDLKGGVLSERKDGCDELGRFGRYAE